VLHTQRYRNVLCSGERNAALMAHIGVKARKCAEYRAFTRFSIFGTAVALEVEQDNKLKET
jgi:hypothetical protein